MKMYPKFCFAELQSRFGYKDLNEQQKAQFADQVVLLSKIHWQVIMHSPRKGLGYEKIAKNALKAPIPEFLTDDVNLLAFRLPGGSSFVGFRMDETLYVLWIDFRFALYSHE